jgi:DnaK suppressor protein
MTTNTLSAELLEKLRAKLEEERDRLAVRLRELDDEEAALVENEANEAQDGGIGSGMADSLASRTQRETDMAAEELLRQHLEEIRAALGRMDAGAYGTCVTCGQPISVQRLQAAPWAAKCIDCASKK